jgi:hypothetical protein
VPVSYFTPSSFTPISLRRYALSIVGGLCVQTSAMTKRGNAVSWLSETGSILRLVRRALWSQTRAALVFIDELVLLSGSPTSSLTVSTPKACLRTSPFSLVPNCTVSSTVTCGLYPPSTPPLLLSPIEETPSSTATWLWDRAGGVEGGCYGRCQAQW